MPQAIEDRFQNLHEFITQARINLDRNNWDYLIGGSETETTLARNRLALDSIGFRPRVLRDVSNVDSSRALFGRRLRIPVLCAPVGGRARVMVDGGISRGTDVVKALILGADAVACGRLYVYGLAAAGAEGVVRVFEILEDEIRICLSLLGVSAYDELDQSYIRPPPQVTAPHVHSAFPHLNLPRETY